MRLEELHRHVDGAGIEEDIGLLFAAAPGASGYTQTPEGAVTFAWTGGDGVHFSVLAPAFGNVDDAPVVMTVPMARDANRVVGANLVEFVGLGMAAGFFILEQLQYDFAATVRRLDGACAEPDWLPPHAWRIWTDIAKKLGARPWPDHGARFAALEREYGSVVSRRPGR